MMRRTNPQRHFRLQHPRGARRPATCEEVGCRHYYGGWTTILPVGHHLVEWLRHQTEWRYQERLAEEGLIAFEFEAGQKCFSYKLHTIAEPVFLATSTVDERHGAISYPDGDGFVGDWDSHLRKIKSATE